MNSVLITGSNRGLGLGLIQHLLKLPNSPKYLFATCRNPEKAEVRFNNSFYLRGNGAMSQATYKLNPCLRKEFLYFNQDDYALKLLLAQKSIGITPFPRFCPDLSDSPKVSEN